MGECIIHPSTKQRLLGSACPRCAGSWATLGLPQQTRLSAGFQLVASSGLGARLASFSATPRRCLTAVDLAAMQQGGPPASSAGCGPAERSAGTSPGYCVRSGAARSGGAVLTTAASSVDVDTAGCSAQAAAARHVWTCRSDCGRAPGGCGLGIGDRRLCLWFSDRQGPIFRLPRAGGGAASAAAGGFLSYLWHGEKRMPSGFCTKGDRRGGWSNVEQQRRRHTQFFAITMMTMTTTTRWRQRGTVPPPSECVTSASCPNR